MSELLRQLGSPEAILLMYLAGELDGEDRAQVERMLAGDVKLRGQLDALRAAQATVVEGMEALDRVDRPAVAPEVALRQVSRAMRQWQVQRATSRHGATARAGVRQGLRFVWWAYPTAAAAAVLLAFVTWWGHFGDPVLPRVEPASVAMNGPGRPAGGMPEDAELAAELARSFGAGTTGTGQESNTDLGRLEAEVGALADAGQADWQLYLIGEEAEQ